MITGIGHCAYFVTDMDRAMDYYCRGLGLTHAFELKDDHGRPWIQYLKVADGMFIELFYGSPQPAPQGSYSHLCLEVDDIQAMVQRLRDQGLPLDAGPSLGKDGNWQCWSHDPDGNRIEFMQISPDSLQRR